MEKNDNIVRWLQILGGVILTDFYLFSPTLSLFPYGNTKMLMAAIAIVLLLITPYRNTVRTFVVMCIYALFVSLCGYITVVINNTHDYTYVTYVISMAVWLGGAYTLARYLRVVHNDLHLRTVAFYLVAVCALQCISALIMSHYAVFVDFVDRLVVGQKAMMEYGGSERLYGISCGFDVAGIRFSSVLIIAFFFLKSTISDEHNSFLFKMLYCLSLAIIAIIGNSISRTTSVGLVLGLFYVISQLSLSSNNVVRKQMWKWLVGISVITILIVTYLYYTDPQFKHYLRFGFEGFFSLAETGEWNVHSNEVLRNMYIFPNNFKTWLFGDGLFIDTTQEPWYVGPVYKGYYMGTDIGYLRFIFYFGVVGLLSFITFLLYSMKICIRLFPCYKAMFYGLMLLQFIIFAKVATDIFMVFAIYITCGFVCKQFGIKDGLDNNKMYVRKTYTMD